MSPRGLRRRGWILDMSTERDFRKKFKGRLLKIFPDAIITHLDPNDIQGIPDICMFWRDRYFMFETKRFTKASKRPNQQYYIDLFDDWSYARFVQPENMEEVLNELEQIPFN